ncbi:13263_t:CDS:2, partial [Entrophospora sp. SA101]
AWHEHITNVEALSNAKKDKEALARWKRLIVGIKIKMRIHSDYFSRGGDETDVELEEAPINDCTPNSSKKSGSTDIVI